MKLSDGNVDIIIPIYNAFDELVRCIDSVEKWTDLEKNRLILINDNSPDGRIAEFLDQISKKNIIVIHNRENKGFSANINIGMLQSEDNDVILLNSDTVVTHKWVEKIVACAYSDRTIATVTPLSNNATLCSVPIFCEENVIPEGYSVDEYAELIENISIKKYPRIPVAHGFCMFIKREVIRKIGSFDEKTFERGYGEENDFCYRASEVGFCHAMCDDTFILHTGTSSFVSEEKRKYIEAHEKILDARYPDLMQSVRVHCEQNPNRMIQENVKLWTRLNKRKKRKTLMYLVQADFRKGAKDNVGGTQLHVKDLTMKLREAFDIVVVARDGFYLNLTLYTKEEEFFFRYYIGLKESYTQFYSEKFALIFKKILVNFGVDCVHIHHTLGLSLEMFYKAVERNIPVFVTMHDYYYICPTVKLLNGEHQLCIGKENDKMCSNCLKNQLNIADTVPYMKIWREEHLKALKLAKQIFVPSISAKKIVTDYYKELESCITVIEHGVEGAEIPVRTRTDKKILHVAFLGGISIAKGYQYATEMIKKGDKNIHWYLLGKFEREDELERALNFTNVGEYKREELPVLMKKYEIDVVCILPIWPETFCYTISEAVQCGVPVVVTDVGALGDRVREMDCGWIVPHGVTAEAILHLLKQICNDENEYQNKLDNIKKLKLKNVEKMCAEYREIYDNALATTELHLWEYDIEWLLEGKGSENGKQCLVQQHSGDIEAQLEYLESELQVITSSFTYRLMRKVVGMKLPFRSQLKAILLKLYRGIGKRN